jgi:hypothetical protein
MYINNYDKYDTLLLTGDFRTDLSKYNITNGSYGLKLDLYQKNTTDNNEEVTNQTFAVLSNKDMMGNPYSFELDTPQ